MFVDEIKINVKAGRGGNGKVAYRREPYVAFGGPNGGNGGDGGSIFFIGDEGMNTLTDFRYNRHLKALNGEHGKTKGMYGKNAANTYMKVPLGTIVTHLDGRIIGEITHHDEALLIAKGGKGGRGNMAFATNKNKAPDFAELGDLGEEFDIKLELKVLADVGLLGYPSVGKSTLLSVISNAKPKIAEYEFTTLSPNLGMVNYYEDSFVVADLPGLIENAHLGVGLGLAFLKHIERCRILLHVVSLEREDPYLDYLTINKELISYDEDLINKPQIIVVNKTDLDPNQKKLNEFIKKLKKDEVYPISAVTKDGLKPLLNKINETLKTIPKDDKTVVYHYEKDEKTDFIIKKGDDGVIELSGDKLFTLFNRTDFNNETAVRRFARQLRSLGIDEALINSGVKSGDTVRIFSYEFEYIE
ncbi:MAG: GTPase ObgE [Acholeplasmataceae bacterium]